MAIIVTIQINETVILDISAQRIKGQPHDWCIYKTSTGKTIEHHYDDGAVTLAVRLLREFEDKSAQKASKLFPKKG
jgi:hypothetical protein